MSIATETRTADQALEDYASAAVQGPDRRLASLITTPKWTELVKIESFERPKTWRLVHDSGGGQKEEIVFALQGSITEKNLPPLKEKPRMNAAKYRFLRQSITISGLGTATFDSALASTTELFGYFDRQFREGELQSWSAGGEERGRNDILEASNRYFTPRKDASTTEGIPFGDLVDPKLILQAMVGEEYVHTEENEVLYFARRTDKEGKKIHDKVGPQAFRIGDLVEIQISFMVVPLKGEQYKMMTVLRSIALIDGSFAQVAMKPKAIGCAPSILKRKVRYDDPSEQPEDERPSKKGMEIDQVD